MQSRNFGFILLAGAARIPISGPPHVVPHGIRNRKKLAGVTPIGMEFEKAPVPSSVPALFVVQMIGADRLVVLSQV
jgi:hypothetical protein